jgi:membrane-bound lytic murein transglycosylase D
MPSAALLARASAGELENAAETIAADVLKDTSPLAATVMPRSAKTYQVKRGDTLALIARRTHTTIDQLKNWNKLRTTNLKVGTRLLIQSPQRLK